MKQKKLFYYIQNYKFQSLFIKNLVLISMLTIAPFSALGLVVYNQMIQGAEGEIGGINLNSLYRVRDVVDTMLQQTDRMAVKLSLQQETELFVCSKEALPVLNSVEGEDYTKTGDTQIQKIPDTYQFDAWQLGNQFNAYLVEGQPLDAWEQTEKLNDDAKVDPLSGFSLDRTPIQNELAQLSAISKEFNVILKDGLDDPDTALKKFAEKRKQAGEDKVKAEIQKQLDA